MAEFRLFFTREMSESFDRLKGKEKDRILIIMRRIVWSRGKYQKETISTKNQSFYSSPQRHVTERVLWWRKGEKDYHFVNCFPAHKIYDNFIDKIKNTNIIFNYYEVSPDLLN